MGSKSPPYSMRGDVWPGLAKLVEEMGELNQVLGKLVAFPDGKHPSRKKPLKTSLQEEIADTLAALQFFVESNDLNSKRIDNRRKSKLVKARSYRA